VPFFWPLPIKKVVLSDSSNYLAFLTIINDNFGQPIYYGFSIRRIFPDKAKASVRRGRKAAGAEQVEAWPSCRRIKNFGKRGLLIWGKSISQGKGAEKNSLPSEGKSLASFS
jgi:hypothetical protein